MNQLTLAYILIALGLFLLVAELFIPSGGVLFVVSICAIIIGVALTFVYGDASTGMTTLVVVFIALPLLGGFLLYYWPKTRMAKRMCQTGPEEDATVASMPVNVELEQLRGRVGRAASALRPSGVVEFDGRRIDVITEGMMVDPETWVRCIDVKAGKVVVRPTANPKLDDLESMDFT
jgi:membrane-bound ClpP family serine protease